MAPKMILPPYCPFCHKRFFGVNSVTKVCSCKRGKALFTEWATSQQELTENLTNPADAISEDVEETETGD